MTERASLTASTLILSDFDVFQDTSGGMINHGDLIRDIAQQQFSINRVGEQINPEEKQTSPLISQKEKVNTEVYRAEGVTTIFPKQPRLWPKGDTFSPLQEWEGYVVDIGEENFTARLVDLTASHAKKDDEEEADFPIKDLSEADKQLLRPGAIFRWVIGYRKTPSGTKLRESSIIFRRLPAWTNRELEENRMKAKSLAVFLSNE